MSSVVLPPELWAKSPVRGQAVGESLHTHTEAVVGRLAELRERLPELAHALGDPGLWTRAFWACVLHDVGKAAAPFQQVLRGQARRWEHRHEIASMAFLPWIGLEDDERDWVGAAIASHHRDAATIDEIYPFDEPEDINFDSMFGGFPDDALQAIQDWLGGAPVGWATDYGFDLYATATAMPATLDGPSFRRTQAPDAVIEGLRRFNHLCRELRRAGADSPANRRGLASRGLMLLADRLASAHAPPLDVLRLPDVDALMRLAGVTSGERDYQRRSRETRGSIVVAAPTGSGKTEAALRWASEQQRTEPHRTRLWYLLPYQASLNAMQTRLRRVLGADVALLHGRATQALYRALLAEGMDGERAERVARRARDLARLQQPAVAVATPYQLLRAAYRLPGYEMQWASVHGMLIVVDEIHAYDPARLGMFLGLLRYLVDHWDAKVCALSATLPSWLHNLLLERFNATDVRASERDFAKFTRHEIRLVDADLDDILPDVIKRVRRGEAVLVAANTVAGAQAAYVALREALGAQQTRLLHSRFTGRDRLAVEEELSTVVGLGRSPRSAIAVVATQTIEVSLNLDFDTIYSDPAPLEALAQRFGRVNRVGRMARAPVHVLTAVEPGQGIYDSRLVQRAVDVLRSRNGQGLDEAELSRLLDMAYEDDLAHEFTVETERHEREFIASCLNDLRAFQSDESLADKFDSLFDNVEVVPVQLTSELDEMTDRSLLEAQGLLVPISHRRFAQLGREGRLDKRHDGFVVANVSYEPSTGLSYDPSPGNGTTVLKPGDLVV